MTNAELGQLLLGSRKRNGLSQQDVAEATGMTKSTISRLESGIGKLDIDHELAILKYLDLPFSVGTIASPRTGDTIRDIEHILADDPTLSHKASITLMSLLGHAYQTLTEGRA